MISSFKLKFGSAPGADAPVVPSTPITVFVGPNNSGKSKVLAEMEQFCRSGQKAADAVVLEELAFHGVTEAQAEPEINHIKVQPNANETIHLNHVLVGSRHGRYQLPLEDLRNVIQRPEINVRGFCHWFLSHKTLLLDGRGRIDLVNEQPGGDLQQPPQTTFQVLFRDDVKRHEVRRIVYEAFGSYLVVDPTNMGKLRVRLSVRPPREDREERGLHAEAVAFHSAAVPINLSSDGVKAFTGIVVELLSGDPKVFFIDEPEAFLHPALASKLGNEVSRAALNSNKRVYISTHSPMFVMGCIQSGAPVNIVRLTYRGGVATSRLLPSDEILELMRNPLLRSTGVLTGLFYEFVIVTESDADRAFYQEVNERLLRFDPERGIPNCLFINAQNKQTVPTILRPLRKLGIPAVALVDIDVVKEGGAVWGNLMSGSYVPAITGTTLGAAREAVNRAMIASGKNMKRDGGVSILTGGEREAAENLLGQLATYGMFVVPGGELESWLPQLGATGHGPGWLIDMFQKMGEDVNSQGYVKPTEGDVWTFMSEIKTWLIDPERKGIPV